MGMDGKLCEHLFLVLKHAGPGVQTVIPKNEKEKKKLYRIVTGKKPINPERGWFANLSDETNNVIEDQSKLLNYLQKCILLLAGSTWLCPVTTWLGALPYTWLRFV